MDARDTGTPEWKLIVAGNLIFTKPAVELYNLISDPEKTTTCRKKQKSWLF
jgi:hypothetical protein